MRKLLMGMTCFGSHIDTFFNYCYPSLLADGNLPALKKERDVAIVIHTDKEGERRFKNSGAAIYCEIIAGDKYAMLGRHQYQDLRMAKEHGADYHLLMPDFIYSENCFSGVLKAVERGHKAITRLVISTVQETIMPELNRPRSAIDLATLSIQHIHPRTKHWFATKEGYPHNHVLVWETENTLRMCSPHQTPVYIANEAIKLDTLGLPLDSILDRIIEGDIYCPQPDDGIVIIEMSPKDSVGPSNMRVNINEYCRIFQWDTKNSKRQLELFEKETVDSINREELDSEWWNNVEISEQKSRVIKALEERRNVLGC